jgi:hypothetical protein
VIFLPFYARHVLRQKRRLQSTRSLLCTRARDQSRRINLQTPVGRTPCMWSSQPIQNSVHWRACPDCLWPMQGKQETRMPTSRVSLMTHHLNHSSCAIYSDIDIFFLISGSLETTTCAWSRPSKLERNECIRK